MIKIIILVILAYLIGSIPSGIIVSKLFYHTDIREHGSGNSGASNVGRVFGFKAGLGVFLFDFLKGALAVWLPSLLHIDAPELLLGAAAILGHVYPIFAGFKGGKAVATSAGVAFAYNPLFLFINFPVIFGIVLYFTSMMSVASLTAITTALILSLFLKDWVFTLLIFGIWVMVIYRHKDNITRIKNGTENKINWGLGAKKEN